MVVTVTPQRSFEVVFLETPRGVSAISRNLGVVGEGATFQAALANLKTRALEKIDGLIDDALIPASK